MKNLKLNITLSLLLFSFCSFAQTQVQKDCEKLHPNMTHEEWVNARAEKLSETEKSSWRDDMGDWKEIIMDHDDEVQKEDMYDLYLPKGNFIEAEKEYSVDEDCDLHNKTGVVKYKKPVGWWVNWKKDTEDTEDNE